MPLRVEEDSLESSKSFSFAKSIFYKRQKYHTFHNPPEVPSNTMEQTPGERELLEHGKWCVKFIKTRLITTSPDSE